MEFQMPLYDSILGVSDTYTELSSVLLHQTFQDAYGRFTPSDSD